MNDEECREVYEFLLTILRERQLNWVIDQVNEELRLGKIESMEITRVRRASRQLAFDDMEESRESVGSGKPRRFLATVEYGPKGRLLCLMDAIEQAAANTTLVIHETLTFFGEDHGIRVIEFHSEDDTSSKTLPIALQLVRGFVGLISDLGKREERYFIVNTSLDAQDSVRQFLSKRAKAWDHNIVPGSDTAIARLTGSLQTAFKNYKARQK